MLSIDTATQQDFADLAARITRADAEELRAAGLSVDEALAGV